MLNDVLPETAVRIERDSKRVNERLGVVTVRLTASLKKKKNRSGSKEQRNEFLNSWTNLSILASEIMNSGEMEERKKLEEKATYLVERLQNSNVEVEEW